MADPEGYASDENTIIASQRSSQPSTNARNLDEEIMPRARWLKFLHNNHHLDLDSNFDHNIIIEIIRGHPVRTVLTRVEQVPAIYLQQFWHTLQFRSTAQPPRFTARIDHFDVRITLRGIRRALELPFRENFDDPASEEQLFADIQSLGYQDPEIPVLNSSTKFRRKHLPPIWYTLCAIFNRCMTSKHTGIDKVNLTTLRMFHAFAFNLHIDYAVLIWNEMVDLVADQAHERRRRKFVPFQRFFQILIHQAMVDKPEIPRREDHPRGPSEYMHRLLIPRHADFAHIAVIREDVLNYADRQSWVVIQYREQNALMAQPDPAGPAQDAIPLGGEGPNVEGVQEQGDVPEQREVRSTIRKSVGRSSRTAGHDDQEPLSEPINPNNDDDDDDQDPDANLVPRRPGKRPRVETSDVDSVWHNEPMDTTFETAGASAPNEGVEVDVEMEIVHGVEERGSKETSEHVTESDKVLTTDSSQADLSRVPTSSANVRLSPLRIETDMVRPTMQCTPPPIHSSVSQQAGVSFSTGEQAHTLSAAQSVLAGIEAGRLQPRPPPFFQSTSSLAPFGSPSIPRTQLPVQHQVGSFRAPTGTPRVPPFVGASQGPGGRPIIANTMPALNIGRTVPSTATSTSNLRGLGVSDQAERAEIERALALVGPPPNRFMPFSLMKLFVTSINNSLTAHETRMTTKFDKLSEEVNKTVKGKEVAESSTPASQPSTDKPVPHALPNASLHLVPEDRLQTELLSRMLTRSDDNTPADADLISLLRQQTQPPPQSQAASSTDNLILDQFQKLNDSMKQMADSLLAGFQTLDKRMVVVEQKCGIQSETEQKRRHDDPDDPDHHEGERRTGDVGTSTAASTGNIMETGTEKTTGTSTEGNKGKGATDTEIVQVADVSVLADVIVGVEKPSASDNRTEDDWMLAPIHVDSDEEPERTTVQLQQEIEEVFGTTGTVMADPDSDNEAPATSTQPQMQSDQSAGTSAPLAPPVIPPVAPLVRILPDVQLRDPKLIAELRHLQEIIQDEPRFVATGLRVRIVTPYQESLRRNMFLTDIQKISWERVYGIEDWPERHRIEYLYFMRHKCLNIGAVRSDKSITKVLQIESTKLSRVWFPEFTVQRSDGSVITFTEADFDRLKLNDICNLYEILSREPQKKGDWSDAYQSLKRFMKNILKFSYLKDFQMALEARQERVNIKPPNRRLPDLQSIQAYTVLTKPELGVVYPDANGKMKFLRIIEANKFCDGTFKMIQIYLNSRLRMDAEARVKMTDREKAPIKEVLDKIKDRVDYRNALRRFEITFGLRKTQVVP